MLIKDNSFDITDKYWTNETQSRLECKRLFGATDETREAGDDEETTAAHNQSQRNVVSD